MSGVTTAAYLALLAGAGVTWVVRGVLGVRVSWLLALAGSGAAALSGALALAGHPWASGGSTLFTPLFPGVDGPPLRVDPLSGLFLLIIGVVGLPALLVCASWAWRREGSGLPAAVNLLLLSCVMVVTAADVWVLVVGWELLTISFYWLTGVERNRAGRVDSAIRAVGFGKVSGAALMAGLLLLVASSGSTQLDGLAGAHGAEREIGYVLLLVSFAVKVGLVPLHVWMPPSYSAAPGPVRGLMAGVAVNAGFYGCWRTLEMLGSPPGWLASVTMVVGGLSALIGIAHAAVQSRLTRIIAYSSVENGGLIFAAYGVALVGSVVGSARLTSVGLLAATLQVVAHAIGKTLLFVSAGSVISATGTDSVEDLRGVARVLPWSGTGVAIGAATMAGLPPSVLFVSEWFVLESLMQQFRIQGRLAYALPMAATGALVALTAGFAGVAFIRLIGFTVLGRTPAALAELRGGDARLAGRVGIGLLGVATVAVAGLAPLEIPLIGRGLSPVVPAEVTDKAVGQNWVLGPVYESFSVLSPSWLCIELPLMALLVLGLGQLLSRGHLLRLRTVDPWRSATGGVTGLDEYTPWAYANPTRRVLAHVLLPSARVREIDHLERDAVEGEYRYESDVVDVSEAFLYRPLVRVLRGLVRQALRLQNGRLEAYLLYMLVAVVAVVVVVGALT